MNKNKIPVEFKTCTKCGLTKPLADFHTDKRLISGLRADCKDCERKRHQEWKEKNPDYYPNHYRTKHGLSNRAWKVKKREYEERINSGEITIPDSHKLCTTCWKILPLSEFYKNRKRPGGISHRCKICSMAVNNKYVKENPTKVRDCQRKWDVRNREKRREYSRKGGAKNRSTIQGRINNNLSSEINKTLRGKKNGRHWETIVGFTAGQLKEHLEKKFRRGMSWDNYGKVWHIDHKIPICAFNYETPEDIDFKRCWSLKNLQPLEKSKNQSKGGRVERPFQPALPLAVNQTMTYEEARHG
jgi:hypothetical protein